MQATPQAPQLALSVAVAWHAPAQQASLGALQALPQAPQFAVLLVTSVHAPAQHAPLGALHAVAHAPQFAVSLFTSTHAPAQQVSLGALHALPHAPQWALSLAPSTQAWAQHRPLANSAAQSPSALQPAVHRVQPLTSSQYWPAGHLSAAGSQAVHWPLSTSHIGRAGSPHSPSVVHP
jgi:hypothetical protein